MPDCALVNGEWKSVDNYSSVEWDNLKISKADISMLCCREKGHTVSRKNGKCFFRHNRGSNCSYAQSEESDEHYELKCKIAEICRKLGWSAKAERTRASVFKDDGVKWRADVLAYNDDKHVAFEVQYSYITLDSLNERSSRYKKDGMKSIWLFCDYPSVEGNKRTFTEIDSKKTPENLLEIYAYPYFNTPVYGKKKTINIPKHLYLYYHFEILGLICNFSSHEISYGDCKTSLEDLVELTLSGELEDNFKEKRSDYDRIIREYQEKDDKFKEIEKARKEIDSEQKEEYFIRKKALNELCKGLFDLNYVHKTYLHELSRLKERRNFEEINRNNSNFWENQKSINAPSNISNNENIDIPKFNLYEEEELAYWANKIKIDDYEPSPEKYCGWCFLKGCGSKPAYFNRNSQSIPFCKKHYEAIREIQENKAD